MMSKLIYSGKQFLVLVKWTFPGKLTQKIKPRQIRPLQENERKTTLGNSGSDFSRKTDQKLKILPGLQCSKLSWAVVE